MNNEIINIINSVYEKYNNDEKVIDKVNKYIKNLPLYSDSICESLKKRKERQDFIVNLKEKILNEFVHEPFTHYFYINSSKIYIKYDGKNYSSIPEDDIVISLYKKININQYSRQYRKKFKNVIMRNIREINLLNSIPESITIQNITSFFSSVFGDKSIVKYFFIIIGDIINKKYNTEKILYFAPLHMKQLIQIISIYFTDYFPHHIDISNYFKYKFNEQYNREICRIIPYNCEINYLPDLIETYTKQNILNIICVCSYYSNRYENSDNYLKNHLHESQFISHITYIKDNIGRGVVY